MNQNPNKKKSVLARFPALIAVIAVAILIALTVTLVVVARVDSIKNNSSNQGATTQNLNDLAQNHNASQDEINKNPDASSQEGNLDEQKVNLKDNPKDNPQDNPGKNPVAKLDATVTAPTAVESLVYNGEEQALVSAGETNGGEWQYKLDGGEYSNTIPTATDAGSYVVYFKLVGGESFNDIAEAVALVIIDKKQATVTAPTAVDSLVYNGEEQALVNAGETDGGEWQYKLSGGTYSDTVPTAKDAGVYVVYYKMVGGDAYNDIAEEITVVVIERILATTTMPEAIENLTYNGKEQALIIAGETNGGEWQYRLAGGTYSKDIPTAKDAGKHNVYYKLVGDNNYYHATEAKVVVTIAKADQTILAPTALDANLDATTITLTAIAAGQGATEYAYNTANSIPATGWQTELEFTGLTPKTTYYFFARYIGNNDYNSITSVSSAIATTELTYAITVEATNVDGAATNPKKVAENGSVTLTFTAKDNYALPKAVTVSGATSEWDKSTGTLTISNPTEAVTVTIEGKVTYTLTATLNNAELQNSVERMSVEDELSITITPTGSTHSVPKGVTVNGATGTYTRTNDSSANLTIKNPTGDVTFTVTSLRNGYFLNDNKQIINYSENNKYFSYVTAKEDASAVIKTMFTATGSARYLVLPEGVTSIAQNAFGVTNYLKGVVIPSTVTSIGGGAFYSCARLESVVFEGSSQLTTIGMTAFMSCGALTGITIPASVTSIGFSAFNNAKELASVTFLGTSFSIGDNAFQSCEKLVIINYAGTEQQWKNNVTKGVNWYNGALESPKTLTINYNYKG